MFYTLYNYIRACFKPRSRECLATPMTSFSFSKGLPATNSQTIIFLYFLRNASIHDLNRFYSSNFAKLELFFENSGIRLLQVGRSPRFRSKSRIYAYSIVLMLCAKFQCTKRSRMWFFGELICIFFMHLHASECEWATPFILSHITYLYVLASVHSNHVSRSQKYQPHVALREI